MSSMVQVSLTHKGYTAVVYPDHSEIKIYDKDMQCKQCIPILEDVVTYDYLKNLIEHYIYDVRMEKVQRGAIYAKFKGRCVDSFYTPGQFYYLNTHVSATSILVPQIGSLWVYDIHNTNHKICYQNLEHFLCDWDIIRGPEEEKKQLV